MRDDVCQCLLLFLVHSSHGNGRSGAMHCGIEYLPQLMVSVCRNIICVENVCFSERWFVFHSCSVPVATVINSSCDHVLVCSCLFSSPCVRADGGNLHSSLPGEGKSDALLIVRSLVYEERIERFFPFVAQCFPWERQEHGISRVEKTEIPILREERGCLPCHYSLWQHQQRFHRDGLSSLYLQVGMDCGRDHVCSGVSWIVDVLHHREHIHRSSFEQGPWGETREPWKHRNQISAGL